MKHYLWQLLIALDQLVNALFLGMADETMSARAVPRSPGQASVAFHLCADIPRVGGGLRRGRGYQPDGGLGLDDIQLDNLFTLASTL